MISRDKDQMDWIGNWGNGNKTLFDKEHDIIWTETEIEWSEIVPDILFILEDFIDPPMPTTCKVIYDDFIHIVSIFRTILFSWI